MRIHILQHADFEGPAGIADWALAHQHRLTYSHLYRGDALPTVDDFDLLVAMGGPMSVNDEADLPWLKPEKRLVRNAVENGRSILGVCLGAQLIASAMGEKVYPGKEREIGWFPVRRICGDGFAAAFPESFTPLHWHGETYDLPAGATRLIETDPIPNQAFQIGQHVLALQFHIEVDRAAVSNFVKNGGHEIGHGRFQQTAGEILKGDLHIASLPPILQNVMNQLSSTEKLSGRK